MNEQKAQRFAYFVPTLFESTKCFGISQYSREIFQEKVCVHRFSSIKHSSGDTHSGASKVALLDHHYRVEPAPQLRPLPRAYAGRLRTVSLSGQHARRHCPWAVCAVCVGGTNSGKTPQPSATARCHCRTRMLSGCSAVSSVPPLASLLTHSCATPCRGWEAAKFWSPTMRVRTA